ncbi:hypothetical protein GK047_04950 [Paenibacillus sp. SYP-B3998]|uniref:Uncharacterized protein n=1 Tax=Paenibacillus sp. SYP-B3998 TaxID=2678564 RepID=A0A6G3ZUI3_9BACL|nr:hypothetical protein [Paenibacillus sp. SYP-B3998]NEW05364.1 hypothetical protein [Paenibacillus sp. SYP-B3998]
MKDDSEFEGYLLSFPGCERPMSNVDALFKISSGYVAIVLPTCILLFQAAQVKAAALK